MIRTLACDTYSQRYDWIAAQMVAVVSPNGSYARLEFVERATYEVVVVHHELAAAVSFEIVIVGEH